MIYLSNKKLDQVFQLILETLVEQLKNFLFIPFFTEFIFN